MSKPFEKRTELPTVCRRTFIKCRRTHALLEFIDKRKGKTIQYKPLLWVSRFPEPFRGTQCRHYRFGAPTMAMTAVTHQQNFLPRKVEQSVNICFAKEFH